MNDELPTALAVFGIGLIIAIFCGRGILREFRPPEARSMNWGLILFAAIALLFGILTMIAGIFYLNLLFFGTDL